MQTFRFLLIAGSLVAAVGCGDDYGTNPDVATPSQIVTASGDITGAVAQFQGVLGAPLNGGTAGSQPAGRREVNWDGVPANVTNTDDFPGDFFNTRSTRGIVMTTPGRGFRASDTNLADVDASLAQEFAPFSPRKTFLPSGSTITDVDFRVPGTNEPASVRGFGVVFSDVDRTNSATIEYFGASGSLGRFEAPVRGAGSSLSFLGVTFDGKIVTRVRITSGRAPVAAGVRDITTGGAADLVIMDDFLYDEPQPVR
ncbi:MAG: hypothetical protein ABW221_05885 [Vicinamibacteria bacterium]